MATEVNIKQNQLATLKETLLAQLNLEDPYPKKQIFAPPSAEFIHRVMELLGRPPKIVLELGSWEGGSTNQFVIETQCDTLIAVDTWLGSTEHFMHGPYKERLTNLYQSFLINTKDMSPWIIPLRLTTTAAMCLLKEKGVTPDIIYVDAGHRYEESHADISTAVSLFPDALICGDDWSWDTVRRAVEFISATARYSIEAQDTGNSWILIK